MKLFEAKKLLLDFADPYSFVNNVINGKHTSKNKKSNDSQVVGQSKSYNNDIHITKYEAIFPNLAIITQRLKSHRPDTNFPVKGKALDELNQLFKQYNDWHIDEKGQTILPMGDNLRLIKYNGNYFIKYVGETRQEIDKKKALKKDISNNNTKTLDNDILPKPF